MKSNRPLNLLMSVPIYLLLVPGLADATVAAPRASQIDGVTGALLATLAVGDIVVIGQNLSPEVPPSTPQHVLGLGLGLVSLAVAFQLENDGFALAFAAGGSLATASSVGRMVRGGELLSHLSFSAAHRGIGIRGRF